MHLHHPPDYCYHGAQEPALGIYKFDGDDRVTICVPRKAGQERPSDFTGAAQGNRVLMTLARAKPGEEKPTPEELAKFAKPADRVHEAIARRLSAEHLQQIGVAFQRYDAAHKALPLAAIHSKDGKTPLLSWRVALLPYLGQEALYKQFKLDEPWDSAHNNKLIAKMPAVYEVPGYSRTGSTCSWPMATCTCYRPRPRRRCCGRWCDLRTGSSEFGLGVEVKSLTTQACRFGIQNAPTIMPIGFLPWRSIMSRLLPVGLAILILLGGIRHAADAQEKRKKDIPRHTRVTITNVDAKTGDITVKYTDDAGNVQKKTFQLTRDVKMFDETGRAVTIDVFESGSDVLILAQEGELKELRRPAQAHPGQRLSDAVKTLIELTDCEEGCVQEVQRIYDMLRKLDTSKDGKIDPAALKAERERIVAERVKTIIDRLDTNKDRKISKEEAKGLIKEHFERIDTDRNGTITYEELLKAAQRKQAQKTPQVEKK